MNCPGGWGRRIDDTHRLVCRISGDAVEIAQCRTDYEQEKVYGAARDRLIPKNIEEDALSAFFGKWMSLRRF